MSYKPPHLKNKGEGESNEEKVIQSTFDNSQIKSMKDRKFYNVYCLMNIGTTLLNVHYDSKEWDKRCSGLEEKNNNFNSLYNSMADLYDNFEIFKKEVGKFNSVFGKIKDRVSTIKKIDTVDENFNDILVSVAEINRVRPSIITSINTILKLKNNIMSPNGILFTLCIFETNWFNPFIMKGQDDFYRNMRNNVTCEITEHNENTKTHRKRQICINLVSNQEWEMTITHGKTLVRTARKALHEFENSEKYNKIIDMLHRLKINIDELSEYVYFDELNENDDYNEEEYYDDYYEEYGKYNK